ncbi:beta-ketoacyl-ACP synthase II [candidate division KSB1 bacterium]|nr:beta-ketoacyl-ACP synthase II [candidate division KSB1 bacterium]NIR72325.1 beta-ketoacyl-ACP synthase II [candidate division KSB1 bacterium]NIS26717.1 beta-ketoacyl-ACP synthase II [candidate division KSB1 bacterium]NIT73463.1 beta-ketoacyl-ACP synthase II [candidate division KSB1 bacterium]NIU27332.1 beta-ketoacyl-ACP synthase II [candidate division KSB1 bacterium]
MAVNNQRVVVTGMGMVTPIGLTVKENWRNILAGKSGIGPLTKFDIPDFPVRIAGEVRNFDPANYIDKKEVKKMDPFIQFAMAATEEAINDARLVVDEDNCERVGVIVGSGQGGITVIEQNTLKAYNGQISRISPFFIPSAIINLASGQVAIKYGIRGPSYGVVSACSTGVHAIADGYFTILRGNADIMVVGGTEATLVPVAMAGFANARALSVRNDEPERASRPFDLERDGFVSSEGAGVIILEDLETAKSRNANIYAEIIGIGMSTDAFHITAPDPEGRGPRLCMQNALNNADIQPEDVDYINAHGTSTPLNDRTETQAVKHVFGKHAYNLPMSSTKSMTGHLLGAAGAVEAIYCIKAIEDQVLPPTINYETPDPECDLDYVPNKPRKAKIGLCLSNSFGFGGTNASVIIKRV